MNDYFYKVTCKTFGPNGFKLKKYGCVRAKGLEEALSKIEAKYSSSGHLMVDDIRKVS